MTTTNGIDESALYRHRVQEAVLRLSQEEKELIRAMTHYVEVMDKIHEIIEQREANQKGERYRLRLTIG